MSEFKDGLMEMFSKLKDKALKRRKMTFLGMACIIWGLFSLTVNIVASMVMVFCGIAFELYAEEIERKTESESKRSTKKQLIEG